MNLTRVLNSALPDIPARKLAESTPRLDPGISFREHIEDGRPVVRIYVPCVGGMFTFEKNEWELTQLFDGKRSFEQIAALYSQQLGVHYDEDSVRDFAASLEASDFWYRTSQEQNIQLMQLSREERLKKLKKKDIWADLSDVDFPAFNPDRFVTWLHDKTLFIYTPWFTIVSLVAFLFVGRDPVRFRPMMIPSMVEKFTYCTAVIVLVIQGKTNQRDLVFAATDLTLGVLFVAAFMKTKDSGSGKGNANL